MDYQTIFTLSTALIKGMYADHPTLSHALASDYPKDHYLANALQALAEDQELDPDTLYDISYVLTQHDTIRPWGRLQEQLEIFDSQGTVILPEADLQQMYQMELDGQHRHDTIGGQEPMDKYNKPLTSFDNEYKIRPVQIIKSVVTEAVRIADDIQGDYAWLEDAKHEPCDRRKALELEYLCNVNELDPEAVFALTQELPELNMQLITAHGKRIPILAVDEQGNVNLDADELMDMYVEQIESNKRFWERHGR